MAIPPSNKVVGDSGHVADHNSIASELAAVKVTADAAETTAGSQAKADAAKAHAVQRANHTGTQSADTLTDGSTNRLFTTAEKTKLGSVSASATANQTDAYLLDRTHHTGTQPSSTISDFTSAVDARVAASGGGSGSGSTMTANAQTSDYTLALSDAGKVIEVTSASGVNVTVPPASSVAFDLGTIINVFQGGSGSVSVVAGSGVTIRNNAPLAGQYAEASLRKRATDEWVLTGDLSSTSSLTLKDYAAATRTAGSISLTSTTPAPVHTSLDLPISAAEGDLVEFGINGLLGAAALDVQFDVYTMPSGTTVNPFGAGLVFGTLQQGVPGWQFNSNALQQVVGSVTRVLTAADVSGGLTTLRLLYIKDNATARTLFATTGIPLKVWAKNYGPV